MTAGRPRERERPADAGSASIWVLAAAMMVLAVGCAAIALSAAISARHRAESAADLAALAGAAVARDGGDGCREAARVASANRARVSRCQQHDDASITVVVSVPLPEPLRRWADQDYVGAAARAGS